jgi:signal transduction histidine kinase
MNIDRPGRPAIYTFGMPGRESFGSRRLHLTVDRLRAVPAGHRDLTIAAVVALLSFTPGFADKGTALGWPTAQRPFDLLAAGLVAIQALPLAIRSRAPGLCLALVSSAFLVYQALGYRPTLATAALYVALYSAGMLQVGHRMASVLLWIFGYVVACAWMIHAGSPFPPRDFALFFALPAGCWLLGAWSRGRLRNQARLHRHRIDAELTEERERIARELHDVVTHHVTAMVMQADAAQYLPAGDREKVSDGLVAIGTTGRHALADLRELLGVLSPEHDARAAPTEPAVGDLSDLVERTRAAGQPVEFVRDDPPPALAGLAELATYRVVQEGLTNALKHAPGRRTLVRLNAASPQEILVEVTTGGGAAGAPVRRGPRPPVSGRGLNGLRRRVELAGGHFEASGGEDGSFRLVARLPARTGS